jgi:prepilin-type N-terminal cleavage/methylation domain-containing protein
MIKDKKIFCIFGMTINSYKKGFTLVELLVVIAIVGLLSAIVLVVTSGLGSQANLAKTLAWSRSINSLLGASSIGFWNFDENPAVHGTVIQDLSGWGNNGTLSTGDGSTNKSTTGVINNALIFDGINDFINLSSYIAVSSGNPWTVELWFRPTTIAWRRLLCPGSGYHELSSRSDGKFMYRWTGGDEWKDFVMAVPYTAGEWYHVVFVANASGYENKINVYGNGKSSTTGWSIIPSGGGTGLNIKQIADDDYIFNGLIDEVHIYSQALTASQIQSRYYAGLDRLLAKGLIGEQEYQEHLLKI